MELESLLMKVKEESEKAGLKLNIKKPVMMAFSPTTSWQIEVGKVKALTDFFSWALKSLWMVTAAMNSKDPRSLKGNL